MAKNLTKYNGTIANHLTAHKDEIWACGNDIKRMREVVTKLLDSPNLKDKKAVYEAKQIFAKAHDSLFLSSLVTYMTGEKVS